MTDSGEGKEKVSWQDNGEKEAEIESRQGKLGLSIRRWAPKQTGPGEGYEGYVGSDCILQSAGCGA